MYCVQMIKHHGMQAYLAYNHFYCVGKQANNCAIDKALMGAAFRYVVVNLFIAVCVISIGCDGINGQNLLAGEEYSRLVVYFNISIWCYENSILLP